MPSLPPLSSSLFVVVTRVAPRLLKTVLVTFVAAFPWILVWAQVSQGQTLKADVEARH